MIRLYIFCLSISFCLFAKVKAENYTLSLQYKATTPNAGGQDVYGLRLSFEDDWELGFFSNQLLVTGSLPLSGIVLDKRFVVCSRSCPVRVFFQLGAGISMAGPVVEALWSLTPLWLFRIDFATHFYFSQATPIIWNYPLWIGLSLPF